MSDNASDHKALHVSLGISLVYLVVTLTALIIAAHVDDAARSQNSCTEECVNDPQAGEEER